MLSCVQVSEWRAVFIKDSQEKVDFFYFISRASGKCVYYKQVESYKEGGGLTKQVCFHVFCYSMNN